jgi:hypothetical protein
MPGTINRLEIFSAGTWTPGNGTDVTFTEDDLDAMVGNFAALQGTNVVRPHLKLGHTEAQKWFGQAVGIPTLGWIDRVWREGRKLFADISNVPNALLDMIKGHHYHNVSAEVFPPGAIEHEGKKFGPVLSAVALLGTEMPAVKDLAGLASALYADQFTASTAAAPIIFNQEANQSMFTQEQVDSLIAAATAKAVKDVNDANAAKFSDNTAQITTLTARAEAAETKLAEQAATFAAAEMEGLVNQAIKDGKLLPKQKDMALGFAKSLKGTMNFGAGGERPATEVFKEFLASFSTQVDKGERGSGKTAQRDGAGDFATAAQELDSLAAAAVSESGGKVLYGAAVREILRTNEDLASRYAKGV